MAVGGKGCVIKYDRLPQIIVELFMVVFLLEADPSADQADQAYHKQGQGK